MADRKDNKRKAGWNETREVNEETKKVGEGVEERKEGRKKKG